MKKEVLERVFQVETDFICRAVNEKRVLEVFLRHNQCRGDKCERFLKAANS